MTEDSFGILRSPSIHNADNRIHKASPASQQSPNGNSNLNPRSCVTCRRRKVKCDKKPKCTNCVKAHIECIYPSPGRAPRKPRKPQDTELMERLRKLEGVVQMLGTQVQPEEGQTPPKDEEGKPIKEETHEQRIEKACRELRELKKQKAAQDVGKRPTSTGLEKRFGRLVVDEGRSRYINPSFWASLSDEVEDIKEILNDSEDEEHDYPSPETSHSSSSHQGFIFGLSSSSVDMLNLHPPPEHLPIYWKIYKENVDPLVKVIHAPSMEPTILESKDRLDKIHRGLEALLFAIYYGSVTSMWPEECRTLFGEEKTDLLVRYRFGIEQALARADFLQTDEMIVLQAFVIFLICLRRNDDARVIWTLTGLIVRMAQTLGLHRDGSHFDLSPFAIEMRRRLWWQICILDARASEDHGCDPTIIEQVFDTKMPLNVDDDELDPDMEKLPEGKTGCTGMTFGLIRFEISNTMRRLQYVPPGPRRCNRFFAEMSLEKKEEWIRECHDRLENRYLKDTDMANPLYWVIATVSRLIMSKMWLMVYHPFQRMDGGSSLPQEVKDKLFRTSMENVEYSILLESEERTKRWGWLFRTYVQWHAIAFLLSELCVRTEGEMVERAWKAIDFVIGRRWQDDQLNAHSNKMKSHLWKPLRRLMDKARAEREKALAQKKEQQHAQTEVQIQVSTSSFDPAVPIESLDFGVDRLYPTDASTNDTSTNWADPRMSTSVFNLAPAVQEANLTTTPTDTTVVTDVVPNIPPIATTTTTSTDPVTQFSSQFNMINSWPPVTGSGLDATSPLESMGTSPLLPDGSINWANWDDMVSQFGMDLDQNPPNQPGQPFPVNSTFGGLSQWY